MSDYEHISARELLDECRRWRVDGDRHETRLRMERFAALVLALAIDDGDPGAEALARHALGLELPDHLQERLNPEYVIRVQRMTSYLAAIELSEHV